MGAGRRTGGRRRAALAAVLLLLALALGGCASGGRGSSARAPRTTVRVVNRAFAAYTVYVVTEVQRQRLGTVQPASTAVFVIPPSFVPNPTTLRFQADPIGGDAVATSFRVDVTPGEQVELSIF